jgi:hypothetical protein
MVFRSKGRKMRSYLGCGLSLADRGIFCPSCGWREAATT